MQIEQLSIDLLSRLKSGENYADIISKFEQIKTREMVSSLSNDEKRKAFWINIYNAFSIIYYQ